MVIGSGPSREDVKLGLMNQGEAGKLLKACLKAGLQELEYYATNLMCWQKQAPEASHFDMCSERFEREMQAVRPKIIFTLGKEACERLIGVPFGTSRAVAFWLPKYEAWAIPTWHPVVALLTTNEDIVSDLVRDFKKASLYLDRTPQDCVPESFTVLDSGLEARQVLRELPSDRPVALDVETYFHLGGREATKLASLAISTGDKTWVFTQRALEELSSNDWQSRQHDVQWTFHNGMFDTTILYKNTGVRLPVVEDTMLQSYSLDNRSGGDAESQKFTTGIHGLKRLAAEYEGAGIYNISVGDTIKAGKWGELYKYNAYDAYYTAKLTSRFRYWQVEDDVRDVYEKLMIPSANMLSELQERGVPIDIQVLGEVARNYGQRYLDMEDKFEKMSLERGWTGPPLNAQSPKQMCVFLYDICKIPLTKYGRTTSAEAMSLIEDEFVDVLQELKHVYKMVNTYVIGIEREMDEDGRVHPQPKLHGTVTGRLSYTNPPVQTLPSDYGRTGGEGFGSLRKLFAARPGYTTFVADYEQAELWSMYFHSGDETMLADLQSGDFHSAATATMFQVVRENYSKLDWQALRFQSKYVTFGVAYGRGAATLHDTQLKQYSKQECQEFIDNWGKRYWKFREWSNEQKRVIVTQGEQIGLSGRKFRYPVVLNRDAFRKCVNHPIQSGAHDHLVLSMLELHPLMNKLGASMWFDVHDAILGEIPNEAIQEVSRLIVETMEKPRFNLPIGIPVELKLGTNWRDAKAVYSGGRWVE